MQKIVMQKIIELNTEEAKAVAGGALRRGGHGDSGGSGFGEALYGRSNRDGRQLIAKKR
jgi:hypothetical protein